MSEMPAARVVDGAPEPFIRASNRHRFAPRRASVLAVTPLQDAVVRVHLGGKDFHDFAATGPADHVRLYFPDPVTGELVAPVLSGDGMTRPNEATISRDYTPLCPRQDGARGGSLDIDFMLHPNPGPATMWAQRATIGDQLVVLGPKGSRQAPQDASALLLICDETALPSATRWIRNVPNTTEITLIAQVMTDREWVDGYLATAPGAAPAFTLVVVEPGQLALSSAVTSLGAISSSTFVFAAAEATSLVPLRRTLRRELGLPAEQVSMSGYWRRDVVAFDHHSPVDPADPD